MAALYAMVSAEMLTCCISERRHKAAIQRLFLWQQLITAVYEIQSGKSCCSVIPRKRHEAISHWLPFSQALMAALQMIRLGLAYGWTLTGTRAKRAV